ncbi:GGDEF domain-containing protein [Actinoplanes sp. LDG1-06]|uniref:GGDEF domain-containing protein n=1 Tax=Paractinoplanes ovalisporus TaxID=2810368 RepID=A0ABS2AIP8_9ACTN|nr:GGDEF domain-containing protein [Actinoplanes ovalisporus]MBM2619711.1 GGDEF domain-containing protein [Actinoplanes ovalisporus]
MPTWNRRPKHGQIKPGELVPVADRIRWVLGWRAILGVAVLVVWWFSDQAHGTDRAWIGWAVAWPVVTTLSLLASRAGRRVARSALTLSLLGDGVLLGTANWAMPDQHDAMGFLIFLHAMAVTLLASFRTGVRIAIWHCVITVLFVDAINLGMLADTSPNVSGATLWLQFAALWLAVLSTAAFAAKNERELRRRRHDADLLRQFGLGVTSAPDPASVAAALAEFGYAELPAHRVVVVAHVGGATEHDEPQRLGATIENGRLTVLNRLGPDSEPGRHSVIRRAIASGPQLVRGVDPRTDPWLAGMLPGARNVVVLPFAVDQIAGAMVVEVRRRRLERRVVETALQAAMHASVAMDRILLTEHIRRTAETDALTRVANRKRFDEAFAVELGRSAAEGTDLALTLVDIDHFKKLNDTFGHLTGDEVLRLVATVIREAVDTTDLVARYGGEEFAVIMPGRDAVAALAVAERIRLRIGALETVTAVSASLGVATCPAHGTDAAGLINSADAALYESKRNGRDQVTFASAEPDREPSEMAR